MMDTVLLGKKEKGGGAVGATATPTKITLLPSHLSFTTPPSSESASRGAGKRKAQPRKRIIIDDDQEGSLPFMAGMTASTSRGDDEKKETEDEEEGMPSFSDDPVEILLRLNMMLGDTAMQQLLSGEVTPAGSSSLDASSFSALLQGSAAAGAAGGAAAAASGEDGVHPMLQAAALAGLQNTPLAALLSSSSTTKQESVSASKQESPDDQSQELEAALALTIANSLTPSQHARTLTLKRKLFDNNKDAMKAAIASISQEERVDLDDLENFAQLFKKQRIKFGFTQGDVGQALGKRYGTDFSQTTISRFEALNLSFKNMCKLRPLLKEWLSEAELAMANGATAADLLERSPAIEQTTPVSGEEGREMDGGSSLMFNGGALKKRRKRTNLDNNQKIQLDEEFDKNPRPNHHRMSEIAMGLDLDRDVVRVWFCNRRQKVRKLEDERLNNESISSLTHFSTIQEEMGAAAAASAATPAGARDLSSLSSPPAIDDDDEDTKEPLLKISKKAPPPS